MKCIKCNKRGTDIRNSKCYTCKKSDGAIECYMKTYIQNMLDEGIDFEVYEQNGITTFGLVWGQSSIARELGFKRRDVMKVLDWCDDHSKKAIKLFIK